jgi:1-acylglycerone phosphate reductase
MFDTLRIELAPFGVKVTTVVTTPTHSEGFNNMNLHQWAMPENSRYAEVREMFEKQARDEGGTPRMETIKYAEGVVSKLLQDKPAAKFWYGGNAGIIKFMITWFSISWLVRIARLWKNVD